MPTPLVVFFCSPDNHIKSIDFFRKNAIQVSTVSSIDEMSDNHAFAKADVVIYDKNNGSSDYLNTINHIKTNYPDKPVVILSDKTSHINLNSVSQADLIYFKPLNDIEHFYTTISGVILSKHAKLDSSAQGIDLFEDHIDFKKIFENLQEAIFITDEQSIIVYANPAACSIYGYETDEFTGMSCKDIIAEEFYPVYEKYLDDVKAKGCFAGEAIDIHKSGRKIFTQVRGIEINIKGLTYLVAIIRDVTNEKHMLSELSYFKEIIENSSDLIATGSETEKVTYINKAGLDMLGWNSCLDKDIKNAHPDWALDIVKKVGIPHASEHGVWVGETAIINKKGRIIPVSQLIMAHKSPITGKIEYMSTVMRDITDRKEAEMERERLIKTLEQKNAELERFVYTVSHDLKAPLVTIAGFISLLMDEIENYEVEIPDFSFSDCAMRIKSSAVKMSQLLDDLLNFSRAGRVVGDFEKVNFYDIVQEAIDSIEVNLKDNNVAVKLKQNFPDVKCDKERIVEVLVNLIDNAVKFMGDNNEPEIEIGVKNKNREPVFFVKDNGIGIEKMYMDKIFELFERLNHSTNGTGVGLALVKRIIEYHNCRIWVESQGEGKGSTFYFSLPPAI